MDPSSYSKNIIVFVVFPPDDPALFEGGGKACLSLMKHGERRQNANNRDFKIGHYGRLGRLDRCDVTQKTRDLLPSSFWDGMFSPGFSS